MIAVVPVCRVKCRCRVRQFVQQQSATVLMDRVLQMRERLLTQTHRHTDTQTKVKRTRGAMCLPIKSLSVKKAKKSRRWKVRGVMSL